MTALTLIILRNPPRLWLTPRYSIRCSLNLTVTILVLFMKCLSQLLSRLNGVTLPIIRDMCGQQITIRLSCLLLCSLGKSQWILDVLYLHSLYQIAMWQAGCLGIHLNLSRGFLHGKDLSCESAEQFPRLRVSLSTSLITRHAVPEAAGSVCDAALTRAPFANQAVFVSKGNGAQAGILNFESQMVMPVYS